MSADRIAALEAMAAADPADPLTQFLLGSELARAGEHARAAEALARCVAADPNYTAAWKSLGDARRKAGDPAAAIAAYREGAATAERTGDLQVKKECEVFLRQLEAQAP
jgi:predicted Zn-dependent protease